MIRSPSLLVLFRERRRVLSLQRQVVRCSPLKCQKFSKRQLSDTVKVLSHQEEVVSKDERHSKKNPQKKLLNLDYVFDEKSATVVKEKKILDKEKQIVKDVNEEKVNEEVLKKEAQEIKKLPILDIKEESDQKPEVLASDQEQSAIEEIGDVKSIDNVENEFVELNPRLKSPLKEQLFVKREMSRIHLIKSEEKLLHLMDNYLEEDLRLNTKNVLLVGVMKNLERFNVVDLGEERVKALKNHLDYRSNITKFYINDLLNFLEFFMKGSKKDNEASFLMLHEMCWRLRKASLKSTLLILQTVKWRQTTDKRREVYELGKKRLLEIIGNISSPKELLMAMYLLKGNEEAQLRLQEEASIMLENMDSVQTYKLIYLLAINFSKNMSLAGRAAKQLGARPVSLDLHKLKNLFFACGVLRINDQNLFREMSLNMLDLIENDSHLCDMKTSLTVIRSCSLIRWNYKYMTNQLMKEVCENVNSCLGVPDKELFSLVQSIGHLNLIEHSDLALRVSEHLVSKGSAPDSMLSMNHSLACLQKADNGKVYELLQPAFYQPLLDSMKDKPPYLLEGVQRKLLNLYGYLKEDRHEAVPDIDGQAKEWRDQLQEKMKSVPLHGLARVVSEVLTVIAPLEKYTNTNVVTKYGYTIDFEIFMDKKMKAVRLDSSVGMQKVWIKMLDYSGYIQGDAMPEYSGDTAMMLRHLKAEQEAAIVYVPFFDWGQLDKKVDHLIYLETKIREAVEPPAQKAVKTDASTPSDVPEGDVQGQD